MPNAVDLKELANTPGFGKAAAVIREKVDPDWGLAGADGLITFEVEIEYRATRTEEEYFTVKAQDRKQAIKKAEALWSDEIADCHDEIICSRVL